MQIRTWRLSVVVAILLVGASAFAVPSQLGMSYSAWDQDLTDPAMAAMLETSLDRMAYDGVTTVALNVFWFQDNRFSTSIAPDYGRWSTQPASIDKAVAEFQERGMKVVLKPLVDVPNDWRGNIPGTDAWFDNPGGYKDFMDFWSGEATRLGVDGLSVGCEFKASVWNQAKWREVIEIARTNFSGPLTYSANWDNFHNVGWWDALDEIGIDAYFPLTGWPTPFPANPDATPAELAAGWDYWADLIELWRNTVHPDMDVVFTELGYRSLDGVNCEPWEYEEYGTTNVDLQEQAECYYAALAETWGRDWLDGYYWWIWDTDPMAGIDPATGLPMNDFTPQNKPAEVVLRSFYVPEPATLALVGAGLLALARRRRRS